MDSETANVLIAQRLKHMTVITLQDFEDAELKEIKKIRTLQEYCWTCTPSIITYCLDAFKLKECTYLDADIYFFAKPDILQREMPGHSVLITEHRYHPDYDYASTSGRFCVQYVTFKNDKRGRHALNWWRAACNQWCYAYYEDGKFGDQKYLDDWPDRFKGVRILEHRGGGIAPWNLSSYDVDENSAGIEIIEKATGHSHPLVFFHFHDLRFDKEGNWHHSGGNPGYHIGRDAYRHIYATYLNVLYALHDRLPENFPTDFPAIPEKLNEIELEKMLLANVSNRKDRAILRSAYSQTEDAYLLRSDLRKSTGKRVFRILTDAGFNLDRYAFWQYPGNYVFELFRNIQSESGISSQFRRTAQSSLPYRFLSKMKQALLKIVH
jgi:hypothetical protein